MIKPIKPSEVVGKMEETIPQNVIKAINTLIVKNWTGSSARFKVSDALRELNALEDRDSLEIKNFAANFMPVYEKAGWKVNIDRPGYNESYETNWTFTKS